MGDNELTGALLAGGAVSDGLAASLQRALGDGYRVDRELGRGGMSRVFVSSGPSLPIRR